jgi:hypothetical protein
MIKLKLLAIVWFAAVITASAQTPLSIQNIQYKSIQDLQNNDDLSTYDGDTIVVEGIVTFNPFHISLLSCTHQRQKTSLA